MNSPIPTPTEADGKIGDAIRDSRSFVLDAGAGSGKTSSLVLALTRLAESDLSKTLAKRGQKIACITFTNVAKDEIIERTGHSALIHTSTIHDFLWALIKPHREALKRALLSYNRSLSDRSRVKVSEIELEEAIKQVDVVYQDRGAKFLEGRIWHDDLLHVAHALFKENPLMAKVAAAKFPFVFVDEYQDTSPAVISILLEHILPANKDKVVVGFFGDKMQSIYDAGIGEIPSALHGALTFIPKVENYRCSRAVIKALNKIRTDIQQVPAGDNAEGAAVFIRLHPSPNQDVQAFAHEYASEKLGWALVDGKVKDLFLTHRLIAKRAGYDGVLDTYQSRGSFSRDQLLNGQDPSIVFFRSTVEPLLTAWRTGDIGTVLSILRKAKFKLDIANGKAKAKQALVELAAVAEHGSVGELVQKLQETKLVELPDELSTALMPPLEEKRKDPAMSERLEADRKFYAQLFALTYAQISSFCAFLEENTPYSTQHGVKGAEFDTVFVYLDDKGANWNVYSFDKYLSGQDAAEGKTDRVRRTTNIFYVACSRARKNLAVIDLGGADAKKDAQVKATFGEENCFLT